MKRIYTSIFTLLLLTVALGTGVFAWFTVNTKASASNLSGTAQAATGGLYIKVEDSGWVTSLELGTILSNKLTNMEFTNLTADSNKALATLKDPITGIAGEANTNYIEFDIEFLTGDVYTEVHLSTLVISSDATTWKSEVDTTFGGQNIVQGDTLHAYLSDAIRVSFDEKIFEKEAVTPEVTVATPGYLFNNTVGFEGFSHHYYNLVVGPYESEIEAPTTRGDLVLDPLDDENSRIVTTTTLTETDLIPGYESFTNYGKVTVRVWLEGWDGQAFNAIGTGLVNVSMSFLVK